MAAPATYVISILINDVEYITFVPFETMDFDDNARDVSYFRFTVENPTTAPSRNQTVVITNSSTTIFDGYIIELTSRKQDNGISVIYEVEAADKKILLQRSVMDYTEYSGTDAAILSSLLSNTYPDLSDTFDFTTGVDSFISDLDMNFGDGSLLEGLNNLSDLAGGADWRFDNVTGGGDTVTFDSGGLAYTIPSDVENVGSVQTGGNPNNCLKGTSVATGDWIAAKVDFGSPVAGIGDIGFDYWRDTSGALIEFYIDGSLSSSSTGGATDSTWRTTLSAGPWGTLTTVEFRIRQTSGTGNDMRLDNLFIENAPAGTTPNLQWGLGADATDFNLDIQSGDEFAYDIELFEGDIDDFNSITVIGGKEEVSVVWTLESDGDLVAFPLATQIKNIVIDKNTGTDGSPTWTTQTDGVFGTDLLTSQGGAKDVLYDPENAWLWFNTAPSALSKSIRVSGEIERPVRVRVEDVSGSDPTYATTHFDDSIKSQDEAIALGQSLLDKRNAVKRVTFKTYEPGLKPGQSITVADSARGLNETVVITNIKTKWIGASGHAEFTVTCGADDLPDASILIANNDKRSRRNALPAATSTSTINFLYDADGTTRLYDADGKTLFEST